MNNDQIKLPRLVSSKSDSHLPILHPTNLEVLESKQRLHQAKEMNLASIENELPPIVIDSDRMVNSDDLKTPLHSSASTSALQSERQLSSVEVKSINKPLHSSDGSCVSLNSKQSTNSVESAILAPILTEQARTRSYIVGSVTHQVFLFFKICFICTNIIMTKFAFLNSTRCWDTRNCYDTFRTERLTWR